MHKNKNMIHFGVLLVGALELTVNFGLDYYCRQENKNYRDLYTTCVGEPLEQSYPSYIEHQQQATMGTATTVSGTINPMFH